MTPAPAAPEIARPTFIGPGTVLAVVTVVLVAALLFPTPHVPGIAMAAATAAYLLSTTVAVGRAEGATSRAPMQLVLAAQVALGTSLILVSDGTAAIGVMPTISMAVLYGSPRAGIAVSAFFTALLVALVRKVTGAATVASLAASAGFAAAATFVVVFSRLALRERLARASVERLAAEVERANGRLRKYAAQVEELATAKERNRIAREIHDGLGHRLTAINVQVEAARAVLARDDVARALVCLERAQSLAHEGLEEVRRSVAVLRVPLRDAIAALVDDCRASGLDVALTVLGPARMLSPRVESSLYRAAQEALTNVQRHARATRVVVTLTVDADDVALVVSDNGVGARGPPEGDGFGLLGLRERVRLLGGHLSIRTAPLQGFTIELRVPA